MVELLVYTPGFGTRKSKPPVPAAAAVAEDVIQYARQNLWLGEHAENRRINKRLDTYTYACLPLMSEGALLTTNGSV
jgi:hypothetical protein